MKRILHSKNLFSGSISQINNATDILLSLAIQSTKPHRLKFRKWFVTH